MTSPKLFLISIVTLLSYCWAFAQDPQPAWRNYNTDHGLPSSEVYVAMQDSKGYMWFGTDNGVSRFDGYTFQNYGPAEGLQNNTVFDLQEDNQGRIWMMTMSGNAYYHVKDSIYPFQYNNTIQLYKEQFTMGVHLYFDDTDSSLYVTLSNLGILQIKVDRNHRLYRSEKPDALVVLELKEKLLYAYSMLKTEERDDYIIQLLENNLCAPIEFHEDTITTLIPEGCINWTTAIHGSIKKLSAGHYLFNYISSFGLIENQKTQWIREATTNIKNIFEDQQGAIFLCRASGLGAEKFDDPEMLEKGISNLFLPGLSAINMTQDKNQGYWFTTSEEGVFYAPDLNFKIYNETSGLFSTYISSFEEKDDSTLFVSLQDGGIFELNTRTNLLQKQIFRKPLFAQHGINDLFYDETANVLWTGNYLGYFSENNWKMVDFAHNKHESRVFHTSIKLISIKEKKQLWAICLGSSIKVDLVSKTYRSKYLFERSKYRIFSGFEDIKEQLWVGREDGLWLFQPDTIFSRPEIMHPSFYHRIEAIQQLPDSTFIIGTKGRGIILWKGATFTEIIASDGLTSDMIENIYVDKYGVIWVGTLQGLNKIVVQPDGDFSIENITVDHGLPSNEITKIEVIHDEIWIGTTKGLVRMPYHFERTPFSNPPFFEKMLINDKMIDWKKTDLIFSHRQNNISFEFLTINYPQNGKIPYRYRLSPSQSDWRVTQNKSISFPALNNGDYRFEVQSQNENGDWSASTTLAFIISPPWWETWWAISLGILAAAVFVFSIYKRRTKQLEKEITLQKQMADVERQALRSQMNPHFIFNALNAIQGYIAQGDKLAANRFLSRFSKLIRAALQHSRMTKVPLREEISSLNNYLELEQMRFKDTFDYHINIADDIDVEGITIPPMLVQPFVENAIVHGLAKIEHRGQIEIDFRKENSILHVTVTDNGIGIESSKKLKADKPSSHKSIGMTITKRRMDILESKYYKSSIEVEELRDAQGIAIGTKVSLQIPLEE